MLSIVIALAQHGPKGVPPAVALVASRCGGRADREVLVLSARPGHAAALAATHSGVRAVDAPAGGLVPVLWALGIRAARGEAVALTIGECEPEPGWDERLETALRREDLAAVGGAIDPPPLEAPTVDWAVYFCRYSPYGRPLPPGFARDVPGDNAAYRLSDLNLVAESWVDGFWEVEVNAALRRAGRRLGFAPDAAVRYQGGVRAGAFLRARLRHGRRYGAQRGRGFSSLRRAAQVALAPVVPLALWARVGRRVLAHRRWRGRFVVASPLTLLFFSAWSLGELVGTLTGCGVSKSAKKPWSSLRRPPR